MRRSSPRTPRQSFDDPFSVFALAISGARAISLAGGGIAFVDDDKFPIVSVSSWCFMKGYARRTKTKNASTCLMHKAIMGDREGYEVDHVDGNRLNNRCYNLRWATRRQSAFNRKVRSDSKSGIKGVFLKGGKWRVRIFENGKMKRYGPFPDLESAINFYKEIATKIQGEFAKIDPIGMGVSQ